LELEGMVVRLIRPLKTFGAIVGQSTCPGWHKCEAPTASSNF
jgi:hypothetical protein